MVVAWTEQYGRRAWTGGNWGRRKDAVLMSRGAATRLAKFIHGARAMREDGVFDCDGFEDQ
jgi:hypothetical protein